MEPDKEAIVEYYEKCNNAYRDAWGLDHNMQLNLGLWFNETKSLSEALINLNAEIAKYAEINKNDLLLDAGCGVGGTAIYMSKIFNCHSTGISLVSKQIDKAKENAILNSIEDKTQFFQMDYMQTSFPNDSFDIVLGIESICYAEPKIDFLKEAFRILKPGGRLVLAENLQNKEHLTDQEYNELYRYAFHGCKVNSLDTSKSYMENLKKVGFKEYSCIDYTTQISPSIKRLRRFFYIAWLYNKYHELIGKPFSSTQLANTKMCYYLQTSLKKKLWSYGIIKAVK